MPPATKRWFHQHQQLGHVILLNEEHLKKPRYVPRLDDDLYYDLLGVDSFNLERIHSNV